MKIESTAFEAAEVNGFLNELRERERADLLARLERVDRRLEALRPRLLEPSRAAAGDAWSAQEVLAHLAVLSKFYGVVAHSIASGKFTEFDLLGQVRLRDVAGEAAAAEPPEKLLDGLAADHRRTAEFLRAAPIEQLGRAADTGLDGLRMTALDVLRLPLITHLEAHLEQLETALA